MRSSKGRSSSGSRHSSTRRRRMGEGGTAAVASLAQWEQHVEAQAAVRVAGGAVGAGELWETGVGLNRYPGGAAGMQGCRQQQCHAVAGVAQEHRVGSLSMCAPQWWEAAAAVLCRSCRPPLPPPSRWPRPRGTLIGAVDRIRSRRTALPEALSADGGSTSAGSCRKEWWLRCSGCVSHLPTPAPDAGGGGRQSAGPTVCLAAFPIGAHFGPAIILRTAAAGGGRDGPAHSAHPAVCCRNSCFRARKSCDCRNR